MRLTLRTLLAYLDDILSPAQAKEIGQKITESNYASQLVDRIRDVMRRRRLTAPDLEADEAGIDASLIAEYLDNTLSPEKVAEVEETCLKSDIHLAEVAACHQILTLVLGEPVEIRQKSRERMYALAPWGDTGTEAVTDSAEKPATEPAVPETVAAKPAASETTRETVPDYLKPAPFWRRARLPIMFLTCVALWLFLLWYDPTYDPRKYLPSGTPTPTQETDSADLLADAGEAVEEASTTSGAVETTPEAESSGAESIASADVPEADSAEPFVPVDPPPPEDEPDVSVEPVVDSQPPAETSLPDAEEMPAEDSEATSVAAIERPAVEAQPPATSTIEETPAEPTQPAAPPKQAASLQYNSPTGILLRYDDGAKDWFVMPRRSLIHAEEQIACPEPFTAPLDVGNNLCRVTLLGGTSVVSRPPSSTASFGFDVKRGRLIIEGRSGAGEKGVVLAISVGEDLWHLQLDSADAVCGVEVVPRKPDQFEEDLGENLTDARLFVLRGTVNVADEKQLRAVASAAGDDAPSSTAELKSPEGENALPVAPVPRKPDWLEPGGRRVSRTMLRYASRFESEFSFEEGVSLTVPALLKSTNPRISLYAAECLDLSQNVQALVSALAPAAHEEARQAAIEGLRIWLPQAPENKELLKNELARVLHEGDAEVVYRLLWGYNQDDARNPEVSQQLVSWLEHEHITVRELAFLHITRLTGGRTYDFQPLASEGQRKAAIRRWRDHVQERGALVQ